MVLFWSWYTPVLFLVERTLTVAHFMTSHSIYMLMFVWINLCHDDTVWSSVFCLLEGTDNSNKKKCISKLHQEKAKIVLLKDRENFSCLPKKTKEKALLKSKSLPNFSSVHCKCDHKFYSKAFIVCVFNFPFVWHPNFLCLAFGFSSFLFTFWELGFFLFSPVLNK